MCARAEALVVAIVGHAALAAAQSPEREPEPRGTRFELRYFADVLGNPRGGVEPLLTYEGRLGLLLDLDLDDLVGWSGAVLHASAHQIHGEGLSQAALHNLMTVSAIEAEPATRLYTLWFEQRLGALVLRAGKLTADQELVISTTSQLFVSSTFGWPTLLEQDLPGGGPAYPFAPLGALASITHEHLEVLAGVFNGDSTNLIGDAPLVMLELRYRGVKVGAWQDFLGWSHGAYAIVDRSLGPLDAFVRVAACPSDRNFIDRYVDAGVTRTGVFGREDRIGVAFAFARISPTEPSRDHEALVEVTYQLNLPYGFGLQPDFQYINHPGGSSAIPDAIVVGVRTFVQL